MESFDAYSARQAARSSLSSQTRSRPLHDHSRGGRMVAVRPEHHRDLADEGHRPEANRSRSFCQVPRCRRAEVVGQAERLVGEDPKKGVPKMPNPIQEYRDYLMSEIENTADFRS